MKYELCIFDLDGTLVDTRVDITTAVNLMLSHYGLAPMEMEEVIGYVGDGVRKLVSRCIISKNIDLEEAVKIFNDAYDRHLLDTTKPYPEVYTVLDRLSGVKKALLTNKPGSFTMKIVDALQLTHYFEVIVCGDTLHVKKPSPEVVNHILMKTGVPGNKAILIGDGKNDVLTARAAGISSVYANYGYSSIRGDMAIIPDFIIDRITDLLPICMGKT
ncbi:MAG: HAD family hydrolase [Spirochaetota bacterium]